MRLYGQAFIIDVSAAELEPLEYVRRAALLNGKTGICLTYSMKSGVIFLALRVEDKIVVLQDCDVRFHPDTMKALEEDLKQVIAFNKKYPDDEPKGHELID